MTALQKMFFNSTQLIAHATMLKSKQWKSCITITIHQSCRSTSRIIFCCCSVTALPLIEQNLLEEADPPRRYNPSTDDTPFYTSSLIDTKKVIIFWQNHTPFYLPLRMVSLLYELVRYLYRKVLPNTDRFDGENLCCSGECSETHTKYFCATATLPNWTNL